MQNLKRKQPNQNLSACSCQLVLLHLEVVVSHYTQERYDCVQYSQTTKRWRHVTCALLQHEILKCALVLLLPGSSSTIPGVFIV